MATIGGGQMTNGDCLGRDPLFHGGMEPTAAPSSSLRRSSAPDIHGSNGRTKKVGKSPDLAGRHLPEAVFLKYEIESAIYDNQRGGGPWDSQESIMSGMTASTPSGHRRRQSPKHPKFRSSLRSLRPHDSYLNSSFRFLTTGPLPGDVDEPLDWAAVDLVLVPVPGSPMCPICLDEPKLPRVTKCGHVFCHLCLLRFAALGPEATAKKTSGTTGSFGASWRRCPICFEHFSLKEIKPGRFVPQTDLKETGGWLQFTLRRMPERQRGVLSSVEEANPLDRISRIGSEGLARILSDEQKAMASLLPELGDFDADLLKPYLQEASPSPKAQEQVSQGRPRGGGGGGGEVYFHQAADGQSLFLHPLSIKMLKEEYGSYAALPAELTAQVKEVEWQVMDGEARRRYRQLACLPLGTLFGLCELDLEPVVSPQILARHRREVDTRTRSREVRAKHDDERRETFYREESFRIQEEIHGLSPPSDQKSLNLEDPMDFPPVSPEDPPVEGAIPIQSKKSSLSMASSFASIAAGASPPLLLLSDEDIPVGSKKRGGGGGGNKISLFATSQRSHR